MTMGPAKRTTEQVALHKAALDTPEPTANQTISQIEPRRKQEASLDPDTTTIAQSSDDGSASACVCKRVRRPIRPIRCNKYPGNSDDTPKDPECEEQPTEDDDTITLWTDIPREPMFYLPAVRIIAKLGFQLINGTFSESAREWRDAHGYDVLSTLSHVTRVSTQHMHVLSVTRGPLALDFDLITRDADSAQVIVGEIQESVSNGSFSDILSVTFAPRKVKVFLLSIAARRISKYQPLIVPYIASNHRTIHSNRTTNSSRDHHHLHHSTFFNHTANATVGNNNTNNNSNATSNQTTAVADSEEKNEVNPTVGSETNDDGNLNESIVMDDNEEEPRANVLENPPHEEPGTISGSLPDLGEQDNTVQESDLDIKTLAPAVDTRCGTPKDAQRVDIPPLGTKLKHAHPPPGPEHSVEINSDELGAEINQITTPQAQSLVGAVAINVTEPLLEELERLRALVTTNTQLISDADKQILLWLQESFDLKAELAIRETMGE